MPQEPAYILLVFIGLAAGASSGIFGIGGGVIIVPALVYLLGYSQHAAIGTSLAVLLPPVGLGAVLEYYRGGNVNLRSAAIVAAGLFVGAWISSYLAGKMAGGTLRLAFGVFIVCLGLYIIFSTLRKMPAL